MLQRLLVVGLWALSAALLLSACSSDGDSAAATATAELPATPAATATPLGPRTGITELDAVLDVLFSGDEDAVRALVRFTAIPCDAEPVGLGSPPMCHPDEPDGSSVDIFPQAYCEGTYVRPEDMAGAYMTLATAGARLYAVYRALDTYWPAAQFVAIYTDTGVELSPGDAYGVSLADGRIVGTNTGCGDSPEEFIEGRRLGDAVLYSPPDGLTSIWDLDIVLDALGFHDPEALRPFIRFQPIACVGPTPGNLGGPPLCQPDESPGTLLAVLPASNCESYYVRQEEIERLLESLAEGRLYAVYRQDDRYVAILSREHLEENPAVRVSIERRHIVRVDFTCVLTPEEALAEVPPSDILAGPLRP